MSPEYLSPGVYVEEVDRGAKPIEGVGTAMAAFVGFAEQGPINQPTFIPNWMEFVNTFGGFVKGFAKYCDFARVRFDQVHHHPDCGGLAGTVWSNQAEYLAAVYVK